MINYTLKQPCDDCPFLREGGIRLSILRIGEIAGAMLDSQGATFQCHKTVDWAEDSDGEPYPRDTKKAQHCAGALIFAEKNGNATQMMRIVERLGFYDAAALMANTKAVERIFDSLEEMLETAI